ncbi:MAG: anti-anti-sigma factor [Verrucomicrobia bacterium]|nr:MAG: anti-anti-sigma factor [Verrucomicrobiota bacterium]
MRGGRKSLIFLIFSEACAKLAQIFYKPRQPNMEITEEKSNDVSIIALNGRLNVTTTADLEKAFNKLFDENCTKILVDCRDLEYISSAGLRVLLAAAKQFKKISGEIALSGLSQNVKQVFEISGFTTIFPIYTTRDEAIKSF